ncbi:MAG: DUF3892 domain-containing protein [Peptococcaceae bacterium]
MAERVVAVNKDPDGNIISVKTSGGQVYPLEQAVKQVENGNLTGVQVVDRNGRRHLRTYSDGAPVNTPDNLPEYGSFTR